jgi:5-aminolevulinate synthase
MTSRNHFRTFLDGILREGRYRTFIDLERQAARPPHAIWRRGDASREVVIWCSNDYLGMGRHPVVIAAMVETTPRWETLGLPRETNVVSRSSAARLRPAA